MLIIGRFDDVRRAQIQGLTAASTAFDSPIILNHHLPRSNQLYLEIRRGIYPKTVFRTQIEHYKFTASTSYSLAENM